MNDAWNPKRARLNGPSSPVWVIGAAALLLVAAAALTIGWQLLQRADVLQQRIQAAGQSQSMPAPAVAPSVRDLTADWPSALPTEALLTQASRLARANDLAVRTASLTSVSADGHFPQAELTVEVSGSYTAVKRWLNDLIDARAGIALVGVEMQTTSAVGGGGGGDAVGARIRMRAHSRPAGATRNADDAAAGGTR